MHHAILDNYTKTAAAQRSIRVPNCVFFGRPAAMSAPTHARSRRVPDSTQRVGHERVADQLKIDPLRLRA